MTTLIIGLIAALGIGGGIAVASNSGGGGHNSPAISAPAVPGEDNSDNPGSGDNPGGDNPGGDNPGGDNPGGDNPGGDNPGGDNPGGDNPGGDNPGGDNPGGDNPGGDNPGGDNPGGDTSLHPNYDLISFLTDTAQYKQVRVNPDSSPSEHSLINDGSSTPTYRALEIGKDGKSFKVTTGSPRLKDGQLQPGGVASYRLLEDKIEFYMDASSKLNENDKFVHYQKQMPRNGSLNGQYFTVQHDYNLYLGGSKAGLFVGDFGFSYEIIHYLHGTYRQHKNINMYDADHLYTGGRTDANPINFAGNALMLAEDLNQIDFTQPQIVITDPVMHGGSFTMNLHLPTASGSGSINMGLDAKYDANFDVQLTNVNQLTFSGKDRVEGKGYMLNGKDGLEAIGSLFKGSKNEKAVSYSFGAKEVK